jgi:integrase
MASTRKQPAGTWQGVAVHPSGRRQTRVFALRKQALLWAQELEATWRRDASFDPRAGDRPVGEWIEAWLRARVVDPVTADKEASHLRTHVKPKWKDWPLAAVRRIDVGAWVKELELAGHGAHTIVGAVRLFSTIMRAAADEGLINANPCARVNLPTPPAKAPFFWTREQAGLILAEVPGQWQVACDLSLRVGLRLGEMLGLRVGAVDWAHRQAHVVGVMTRHGWRQHPKSSRSQRTVPLPDHLLDSLAPLVLGRPGDAIVFPAAGGKPMGDVNFRNRVWNPSLAVAGLCAAHRPPAEPDRRDADGSRRLAVVADCPTCRPVPVGTPHDMRHTAASWLVMDGVDLYRVQELLGHESFATTQRYAHLAPDAHEKIRESWRRTSGTGADSAQNSEAARPLDPGTGL